MPPVSAMLDHHGYGVWATLTTRIFASRKIGQIAKELDRQAGHRRAVNGNEDTPRRRPRATSTGAGL